MFSTINGKTVGGTINRIKCLYYFPEMLINVTLSICDDLYVHRAHGNYLCGFIICHICVLQSNGELGFNNVLYGVHCNKR